MNRKGVEDRVRTITLPSLAPGLRSRVLAAAVVAAPPVTWSDRVWFSRGWRVAACGAVIAVVALEQLAVSAVPRSPVVPARILAESQAVEETGRELGLPADVAASLGRRFVSDVSRIQPRAESVASLLKALETDDGGGMR